MFAFYLTNKDSGIESDLTLGYFDKEKFTGELHWNDVKFKYMFGVQMDDIKVNGQSMGVCEGRECLITFDSGTSLMSLPTYAGDIFAQKKVPTFEKKLKCESNAQFGDLTFVIGGKDYTLKADEWLLQEKSQSLAQGGFEEDIIPFGPIGPELTGGQALTQTSEPENSLA